MLQLLSITSIVHQKLHMARIKVLHHKIMLQETLVTEVVEHRNCCDRDPYLAARDHVFVGFKP